MNVKTADQIDREMEDIRQDTIAAEQRRALANVSVDTRGGMIEYKSAAEVGYMAKMFAEGGVMLPQHLQGNVGACALTLTQAIKWRLDFLFVASQQYVQNGRVNYQSQIFRAIMENSGFLKHRMRHEYIGEGMERKCRVWATFIGEDAPHEYTSPPLKELLPAKNDDGKYKGSPLWKRKPDLQMLYDTQRDWVRMYAPEVFGGQYDEHEFAENEHATAPREINPSAGNTAELAERLRANRRRTTRGSRKGFDEDRIGKAIDGVSPGGGVKTINNDDRPQWEKPIADQEQRLKDLKEAGATSLQDEAAKSGAIEAARKLGAEHGAAKHQPHDNFELRQPGREAEFEAYMAAYTDAFPTTENAPATEKTEQGNEK